MRTQFDTPWKASFERFLRALLVLCFQRVARAIDWSVPPRFLDAELKKVFRGASQGARCVDKLIEVALRGGARQLILLHIEVQHSRVKGFERRLALCYSRLRDYFDRPVLTLVLLADEDPSWRPAHYEEKLLGCGMRFEFLSCKLLDLIQARREELEESDSPAAVLVLANWAAQKTRGDANKRLAAKLEMTQRLYRKNHKEADVLELMRFIDWMMDLPKTEEEKFAREMENFERAKGLRMTYYAKFEVKAQKRGLQEGLQKGRQEGLEKGLETLRESVLDVLQVRFGPVPRAIERKIASEKKPLRLRKLHRDALRCKSAEALF